MVKTNCNIGWKKYFRTNQKRAVKLWTKGPKLLKEQVCNMIKSINKRKNKLNEQRGATSRFKDSEVEQDRQKV